MNRQIIGQNGSSFPVSWEDSPVAQPTLPFITTISFGDIDRVLGFDSLRKWAFHFFIADDRFKFIIN